MVIAIKGTGIAIVCGVTGFLLFTFVVGPYRCNRIKPAAEHLLSQAAESEHSARGAIAARTALQIVDRACVCVLPDIDALIDSAAALQLLSRYEVAEKRYIAALSVDRRPEIFLQLGNTQIALGRRAQGEENLYLSGIFNPQMLEGVEDPLVRRAVYDRVVGNHARIRRCGSIEERSLRVALETFGITGRKVFATHGAQTFEDQGFEPTSRVTVAVSGITSGTPSAARDWNIRNDTNSRTTTDLVSYDSGASRQLLHVVSDGLGGVKRVWGTPGSGPPRVATAAWIFLVYGEVMIGSGDGDLTQFDSRTTEQGRWLLLPAISHSVPANETVIFAGPEGGEFYIGSVAAFPFDASVLPP